MIEILGIKLYSIEDTLNLLGLSAPTLEKLEVSGSLKRIKVQGKTHYSENNIKLYLEGK